MKDWNKTFNADEQDRLRRRLVAKQKSAAVRGIECTLTMEDMFMLGVKLLGFGNCDYTDLGFSTIIAGPSGQPNHPKYPTIERIDDTKGYVRGNVCVVMQRANQLKDNLVDKGTATTIVDLVDRDIVKAMILNMSSAHLDALKTKYIPHEGKTEEENNVEPIIELNGNMSVPQAENSVVSYEDDTNADLGVPEKSVVVEKTVEPVKGPEGLPGKEPALDVPDDVATALAYANYCNEFAKVGMKVSVSFSHFKAKYSRKVCALTGEPLNKEPKFILVLNLQVGFAKDNFIVVSDKIGKAITSMMISTGLSVPKITSMLNRVV